jgi:hypothetical protein
MIAAASQDSKHPRVVPAKGQTSCFVALSPSSEGIFVLDKR